MLVPTGEQPSGSTASWLLTPTIVAAWFTVNIVLLLMNRALLSTYDFRHPICLTMMHMVACVVLSTLAQLHPGLLRQSLQSKRQAAKVATLAAVFAVTVVGGNLSLQYIPVSFNQAIGATTPAWTAVLGWCLYGSRETVMTYSTLIPLMLGIVINTGFEPSFNLIGFTACMAATGARALKSVMQGALLVDQSEKLDSMNLLRYMAPMSLLLMTPAALYMEPGVFQQVVVRTRADPMFFALLTANAVLAYLVNLLNFLVTRHTSALALQVLGNAKGVAAVIVSILVFRNPVSGAATAGYAMTIFAVGLFFWSRHKSWAAALQTQQ
eukprot:jgi/Astpho2/8922/e_gw1.00133.114.1_t